MITGRLLARNTALNLVGQIAPLLVAAVAVPILIRELGTERFGILTLAWALIGYFGLFDFGIGRALTQLAGEALGRGDHDNLADVSGAALLALFGLGVVAALAFAAATPWLVYHLLKIATPIQHDAALSFYIIAAAMPAVVMTAGFRGLFEAHQDFGVVTALRVPLAVLNFGAPLLVLPYTHNLVAVVLALALTRFAAWGAHGLVALRRYHFLRRRWKARGSLRPLLRTGGWMTVSNIVSPLMSNMDRFIVGALLSMSAVSFYVTPYEVITKLLVIPGAISGVFFPAFATTFGRSGEDTARFLDRGMRLAMITIFPPLLIAVALAHEGLLIWVGPDFARESTAILQWLAAGVLLTSVAQMPYVLLQGSGRSDITAKFHLVELPLYALLVLVFAKLFGIRGVAIAWTARVLIDAVGLAWFTQRWIPSTRGVVLRSLQWQAALLAIFAVVGLVPSLVTRALLCAAFLGAFAFVGWNRLADDRERTFVLGYLRPRLTTAD